VGLAGYRSCYPDCDDADPRFARRLVRLPGPIWFGPPARNRSPEGTAYVDGDDYVIVKVADRRPYCSAPPYRVDCSDGSPCNDGSRCVRPGRFCSLPPYVACSGDDDCEAGHCSAGGVIAMRVPRDRVLDPSAYRYWDARAGRFATEASHDPDAVLVDAEISNSVSAIWSTYLGRWVMIHNYERPAFSGHTSVALRTAPSLLGPWTDAVPIMENTGGQKSYNPRFLATPTSARAGEHLVYWTATYDTFDASQPQHGMPFDYNVFLYETDLSRLLGRNDD